MTENLPEDKSEDDESVEINLDLDSIEERLMYLHNNLDEIKTMGQTLGSDLAQQAEDADLEEQERVETLVRSAFLLTRRVERGDRAVVRGQ